MQKSFFFLLHTVILAAFIGGSTMLQAELKLKATRQQAYKKHVDDLDRYYSNKRLGAFVENGNTIFRLFAPQADIVRLAAFSSYEQSVPVETPMTRDSNGVWEVMLPGEQYGLIYNFRVIYKGDPNNPNGVLCLDPYARAVATFTSYYGARRGIVMKEGDYNWESDTWIKRDWRDVVIYEMHVRDMTAHPTSGAQKPGTYSGLIEKGIRGGIDYITSLGVNTVELLPSMEFANIEAPFRDSVQGRFNTWNPYERNHWGYMTAAFFAPEAYYAESWKELQWNTWEGKNGTAVNAFKDMVKAFHKDGVAVIMDVVFNHLSEYEFGNLKEIDKEYYFRLDADGNFMAQSGCGNDFRTERPMARRLIVESVLYWMQEYHVDGFRFDLGKLIDWETVEAIIAEARKINPDVVIVCEPWGGGYDPKGFSLRGWGSWNDQIRNGVKGENPFNGTGWIFGSWYGDNSPARIRSYVNGTLVRDSLGLFQKKEHAVNYLASHDGYTLGDFIRIGAREVDTAKKILSVDSIAALSPMQMQLNKLGALFLLTSQGMVMIHAGDEFARTKVIPAAILAQDMHKGKIDHNSYEKDNETNYINYKYAELNNELTDYYRGLIALRAKFPAFRRAAYENVQFYPESKNKFAIGYSVGEGDERFLVLMNASPNKEESFDLPKGKWEMLVDPLRAGTVSIGVVQERIFVPPTSGFVLRLAR